jgi:hypothetical protein
MGDDVQGPEAGPARKRRGDLARGRPVSLEKDRCDAVLQGAQNGRKIGDATVDEKDFADPVAAVLAARPRAASPSRRFGAVGRCAVTAQHVSRTSPILAPQSPGAGLPATRRSSQKAYSARDTAPVYRPLATFLLSNYTHLKIVRL